MVRETLEMMKATSEKANDLVREFNTLLEIKDKVASRLKDTCEEVRGLEKALSYSSISYEAKKVIEQKLQQTKDEANDLCNILGQSELYKVEKR